MKPYLDLVGIIPTYHNRLNTGHLADVAKTQ